MTDGLIKDPEFILWLRKVDELAIADGYVELDRSYTFLTGDGFWQEMYDEGLTPEEAWEEEKYSDR